MEMTKMRLPCKPVKQNGIWILVSTVAFVLLLVNMKSLTMTKQVASRFSKMPILRQIQPEAFLDPLSGIEEQSTPKKEVQHVAFLKVHKAASSTAQNVFLRYGWYRNLTFVLPPAKNPSGYPNIISLRESLTNSNILPPPKGRHYDILCNHVLYTKEAFSKFMPNDTVFIGILREPFELYKSILNYFRPRYIYEKIEDLIPASKFLRNPAKYEPKWLAASWTNNRMAIEYGFPQELFSEYNQTGIDNYLTKLDKEFKLILIADYMEESMVLMRRYLNWKTKDIIYLNLNVARRKNETMLFKAFDRDLYKSYAKIDYALYNFFYKRLKEQIRQEGESFDDELLHFKELRKIAGEYCKQQEIQTPLQIDATDWSEPFNITKPDCLELQRGEMNFIHQIRIRQYGRDDI